MRHSPLPALAILVAFVGSLPIASHAQETHGEVALSDESVQLRYLRTETAAPVGSEPGELGFGLFLQESRDLVASAHYFFEADRLRFNKLSFKLGPVAYAAMLDPENTDVFAMGLGVEVRFQFLSRQELDLVGRASYAPDILTFGSADKVWDVTARVELPMTDRVIGFAGYRLFEFDILGGTRELEESIIVGARYRF